MVQDRIAVATGARTWPYREPGTPITRRRGTPAWAALLATRAAFVLLWAVLLAAGLTGRVGPAFTLALVLGLTGQIALLVFSGHLVALLGGQPLS